MADEDREEDKTLMDQVEAEVRPPAFKQQLTKDMMNATGALQEQAKSFLKTYDWNLEAALHGYQQRLLEPGARARGLPLALALAAREAEAAARNEVLAHRTELSDREAADTAADANANTQTRAIMQVVVPPGVGPGMPLQVRVPDGRTVQVVVPPGVGPGMPLQVQVPPLDAAERRRLEDAARIYERGSQQQAAALAMTRAELGAYRRERLHERAEKEAEREAVRVADGLARQSSWLPMNQSKFRCQLYREIMCAIRGLDSLDPDARAALVREGVDLVGIARGSDAPFRTDELQKLARDDNNRSLYDDMQNRPEWPRVCGGKKSRRKRTKRRTIGGKKSRKQRKRATIKGGKRKRRRTRRRR